ncbi:MAG: PepSY domain-containing protein [Hydrogenophaga sp.]|uniref:PepSY domain-containing protein n=1 Tax=Hydrogenophaga sp. TaxID=1904254 RepID=UPI001E09540E|nr:PepSY domain-containing protein [Hydrogenophaga sp.]MBX3608384.1 PepSY domain-containing protein [Hydrogenophaga sp.]
MKSLLIATLSLTLAGAALASPTCAATKEGWKNQEEFKKDLAGQGYQIKTFKVTKGNCYEIYGTDKAGKKVEIYFDPISGKVIKAE